ncbi:MAG: NifB/NifX family molybdenum-iron cluster-binding protein [Chloroflexia bacterium]
MKIAAVTEDGQTISQHFGRAPYYLVLTVEEGQIVGREMRDKLGHAQFAGGPHVEDPRGHGYGAHAEDRHARMAQAIADCQVLLAGGMGWGARESLEQRGIRVVMTDIADIQQAVQAYLAGTLVERPDLLH